MGDQSFLGNGVANLLAPEVDGLSPYGALSVINNDEFERIREFSAKLRQEIGFVSAEDLLPLFEKLLAQSSVISFDIFDTLLVRTVNHPGHVYLHLDRNPVFASCGLRSPVHELRMKAETEARRLVYSQIGTLEVTLTEIYAVFCGQNGVPGSMIPSFVEAEEQLESRLCVANPVLRELYCRALAARKHVVCVSDMYLSSAFLLSLLRDNGYELEPQNLFVSCEHRASKSDGKLLQIVLSQLGVSPESVLHIGDAPQGDCTIPKKLGMKAILHTYRASANQPASLDRSSNAALASYCRGLGQVASVAPSPERSFWWRLGYRVFGPLTTGYCQWLRARMLEDGIERAWFVLRDCEILAQVYRFLFPDGAGPRIATLPISRRGMLLPALPFIPKLALSSDSGLLSGMPMPLRQMFERLKLDPAEFAAEIEAAGFTVDEEVDPRTGEQYRAFNNPRIMSALLERSAMERAAFECYLDQQGMFGVQRAAIIDIGFHGTIQKGLQALLNARISKPKLHGYYMFTGLAYIKNAVPGMQQASYLVNCGEPKHLHEAISASVALLERFYTTSSGSLLYFEKHGSESVPVFGRDLSEADVLYLSDMHEGALAFARDYCDGAPKLGFSTLPPDVALDNYMELLTCPTPEEASTIGTLPHGHNMGSDKTYRLAAWPESCNSVEQIWDVYKDSLWRMGLVRQTTPQSAVLRTLLWLNDC